MKKLLLPILSLLIFLPNADARLWTSSAGQHFDGELKEVDDNIAVIRRISDRIVFRVSIADLSQADQDFITNYLKEQKAKEEKAKETSKKDTKYPRRTEELAKWLLGTIWETEEHNSLTDKKSIVWWRFNHDGSTERSGDGENWKEKPYQLIAIDKDTFQYGGHKFKVTLDKHYKKFTGAGLKGHSVEGKFDKRFREQ